jgi:SnoaL-like domain
MANSHSDVVAITQLVNLYGLAVDSRQWHLFDSIFTADVDADYGGSSHWTNLEHFKSDFAAFHDPFDSTQHTMSTHVVDVEGPAAHSFCNGAWRLVRKGRRWRPALGRHGLVRRHVGTHPGRLADHPPHVPHHLVDR